MKDQSYCSFCGKTQDQVVKLIQGADGCICNECVDVCSKLLTTASQVNKKNGSKAPRLPKPQELSAHLDNYVIGQDDAKRALSVAVYNHYKRLRGAESLSDEFKDIEISKSNVLLIGPTGSGKTLLAQTLARTLKVPFAMADATTLTEAGYVGEDVENVVQKLLANADYDVEKAQQGIIYIDEIDKISRKSANPSLTRDVSGEGVQQALLKIIEGTVASIPPQGGRKHPNQEFVKVDTSNILFICGGAFAGLEKMVQQRTEKTSIGFNAEVRSKESVKALSELFDQVEPEDLIKFGLIPEFIGRLPVLTCLHELDEDTLVQILTEPKNALTKQFMALMDMESTKLSFDEDALRAIAKMAVERKTGARGLRSIVENTLLNTMYELPSMQGVAEVRVTKESVQEGVAPLYINSSGDQLASKPKTSKRKAS